MDFPSKYEQQSWKVYGRFLEKLTADAHAKPPDQPQIDPNSIMLAAAQLTAAAMCAQHRDPKELAPDPE